MPSSLKYIFVISIATAPNSSVDIGALGSCRSRNGYLIISYFKTCFFFYIIINSINICSEIERSFARFFRLLVLPLFCCVFLK